MINYINCTYFSILIFKYKQLGITIIANLPQITAGIGFPITSLLLSKLDEPDTPVPDEFHSLFGKIKMGWKICIRNIFPMIMD